MRIVIASDSYKGSVSSLEVGNAIKEGILRVDSATEVLVRSIADGGEGTSLALTQALGGKMRQIQVHDPLGKIITASYGVVPEEKLAIIEMAAASGLVLVPPEKRNPLFTSSVGTGEMILDAIQNGYRRFIVGIGGSATNDGGIGMLNALGFRFRDETGGIVPAGAAGLKHLASIDRNDVIEDLNQCDFMVACDVNNPLCGPRGSSSVFGPQKGATVEMVADMDVWMAKYAVLAKKINPQADPTFSGAGAAGGLGFAFKTFLNAILKPGIDIVLEEIGLENDILKADLVITGEGRLDSQSVMGKAPAGVAKLAKIHNKKVIAIAGCLSSDAGICNDCGIDAFFSITPGAMSLDAAMHNETAKQNLANTAEQIFRLFTLNEKS